MIKRLLRLNAGQKQQIEELEAVCTKETGNIMSPYLEDDADYGTEIKCFYLMYEEETLVSFLSLYVTNETEVEVYALTLPIKRRQGRFKRLLSEAERELRGHGIVNVWLVGDAKELIALTARSVGACFKYSEYMLAFNREKGIILPEAIELFDKSKLSEAIRRQELIELTNRLFLSISADEEWLEAIELSRDTEVYCMYDDKGHLAGILNVQTSERHSYIYNFGIVPELQGRGLGRAMLNAVLKKLVKEEKRICLEVSSKNARAFNLYITNGFEIAEQRDYYLL